MIRSAVRRRDRGDLKTRQKQGRLLMLIRFAVRRRDKGDLKTRQEQGSYLYIQRFRLVGGWEKTINHLIYKSETEFAN